MTTTFTLEGCYNYATLEDDALIDISDLGVTLNGRPVNKISDRLFNLYQMVTPAFAFLPTGNSPMKVIIEAKIKHAKKVLGTKVMCIPPRDWVLRNDQGGYTLAAGDEVKR